MRLIDATKIIFSHHTNEKQNQTGMKNTIFLLVILLVFSSCDPVSDMKANIENLTSEDLTIDFISSTDQSFSRTLQIPSGELVLFQEGFDVGGTFLEPSLEEYDSVVIKNPAEVILRIYKPTDAGKNIYNIKDYWNGREPSKRIYRYEYEIRGEDFEE